MTVAIEASGLVAWYLLVADVMLGTVASAGLARYAFGVRRKWEFHTAVSWALTVAVLTHIDFVLADVFDGWTLSYALELGWGSVARQCAVAATYGLLLVMASTIARDYVPVRWWRTFHRSAPFAVLAFATVHAVLAGDGMRRLVTIVPGVMALTLLLAVFIARSYSTYARRKKRNERWLQFLAWRAARRPPGSHYKRGKFFG